MSQSLIYITAANREEATSIAHELINIRLAACANIITGTTSIFRWKEDICEEEEVTLILKTQAENVDRIVEKVKSMHSYDCPCVISIPISGGNTNFLNWINTETITK